MPSLLTRKAAQGVIEDNHNLTGASGVQLIPTDISSLSMFNDAIFLSGSNENRVAMLERKISDRRLELLKLMRELDLARLAPAVSPVSETAIRDFFTSHPAMSISYEDGKIILTSENQSVAFHTRRGRNAVGENNDVIYVTLPLYSFKLIFHPDGAMEGMAESSWPLEEVWPDAVFRYGHPHTQHSSASRKFSSVCNGNNRFIQDWSSMRHNGVMDGNNTLRILSQAAIWMESANISDMYGTYLAEGPHIRENTFGDIDVDGLFHGRFHADSVPPALRFILDTYGREVYRAMLWPLWMWRHFNDLPDCLTRCPSMYQAAKLDSWIILKAPETFGAIRARNREMDRMVPIALRCYRELGGYYPGVGAATRTFAQMEPDLFPANTNINNMEANNGTDYRQTRGISENELELASASA